MALAQDNRTDTETSLLESIGAEAEGVRAAAGRAFAAQGLPNRRVEAYHYTDLRALVRGPFPTVKGRIKAPVPAYVNELVAGTGGALLTIINGWVDGKAVKAGAWPEGLSLREVPTDETTAGEALAADNAVATLNLALSDIGLRVHVRKVAAPSTLVLLHLVDTDAPVSAHARFSVDVEAGAKFNLIEIVDGQAGAAALGTVGARLTLGADAEVFHARLVLGQSAFRHLAHTDARLGAAARYDVFHFSESDGLVRQEVATRLDAPHAHMSITGILLGRASAHTDLTITTAHEAPETNSVTEVRAILRDRARGVAQAEVQVAQAAQKTDAQQLIKGLLMSPRAELDAKPALVIFADDVKCSHGCASGDIDEEAVYYMQSRGIPKAEARALLAEAFVAQSLEAIPDGALKAFVGERLAAFLQSAETKGTDDAQ